MRELLPAQCLGPDGQYCNRHNGSRCLAVAAVARVVKAARGLFSPEPLVSWSISS